MKTRQWRGSRKHIIDLLDSGKLVRVLNSTIKGTGVSVSKTDKYKPKGYADSEEWTLRQFCRTYCQGWFNFQRFDSWWVPDKYKNPTWDLLSTCTVNGQRGLLLVEAKAHESELDYKGKSRPRSSRQSRKNHAQIGRCIREAALALSKQFDDIRISQDTHYQLSNRVASAWKLAECGLPVVLLYLGFIGDTGIANVGTPFDDSNHWQRVMGAYMTGVLPQSFPDKIIKFKNRGSFRMLIRSLPIIKVSRPSR